jgi:hypothetical protein
MVVIITALMGEALEMQLIAVQEGNLVTAE